jgi:hypothetical protein
VKYVEKLVSEYVGISNKVMNYRVLLDNATDAQAEAYLMKISQGRSMYSPDFEITTPSLQQKKVSLLDMLHDTEKIATVKKAVEDLKRIVKEKGLVAPQDMVVYRGLGIPEFGTDPNSMMDYFDSIYQVGKMTPPHFMSTSIEKAVAQSFISTSKSIPVLEELLIPKGTNVYIPDAYGLGLLNEKEIIIPPTYRTVVESITPEVYKPSAEWFGNEKLLMKIRGTIVENKLASAGILGAGLTA